MSGVFPMLCMGQTRTARAVPTAGTSPRLLARCSSAHAFGLVVVAVRTRSPPFVRLICTAQNECDKQALFSADVRVAVASRVARTLGCLAL